MIAEACCIRSVSAQAQNCLPLSLCVSTYLKVRDIVCSNKLRTKFDGDVETVCILRYLSCTMRGAVTCTGQPVKYKEDGCLLSMSVMDETIQETVFTKMMPAGGRVL